MNRRESTDKTLALSAGYTIRRAARQLGVTLAHHAKIAAVLGSTAN